jgi:hypothetical protein
MRRQRPTHEPGSDSGYEEEFEDYGDDDFGDFGDDIDSEEDDFESARDRARARSYRPAYGRPSRRPAGERDGAFNALVWLLDGATGFVEELRHNDLGLSEEFWVHAYAARRESLLALRAVLNDMLDGEGPQQDTEQEPEQRRPRRGNINID